MRPFGLFVSLSQPTGFLVVSGILVVDGNMAKIGKLKTSINEISRNFMFYANLLEIVVFCLRVLPMVACNTH